VEQSRGVVESQWHSDRHTRRCLLRSRPSFLISQGYRQWPQTKLQSHHRRSETVAQSGQRTRSDLARCKDGSVQGRRVAPRPTAQVLIESCVSRSDQFFSLTEVPGKIKFFFHVASGPQQLAVCDAASGAPLSDAQVGSCGKLKPAFPKALPSQLTFATSSVCDRIAFTR
jgi:hypothetical protein